MGGKENPALEISFQLAINIVKKCQQIQKDKKEFNLTNQLIRSATSIGANLEEAVGGQSERDFMAKLSISYKEARETNYWLKLLRALDYLTVDEFEDLSRPVAKMLRILGSSIKTLKHKLKQSSNIV